MFRKHKWKILIGVVLLAALGAFFYAYPLLSMTPVETGIIAGTEILAVQNNRNSIYLIPSDGGYIMVDAGSNKAKVAETLKALSIDPASIRHVLLTHSDSDHVGALTLFTDARIYMSEDEFQMVDGSTRRSLLGGNSLPGDIGGITPLSDDQVIDLDGVLVKCIKLPGHTPGSIAYLMDDAYLFTGDAARVSDGRLMVHPFTMDQGAAQKSIERILSAKENSALLLTAHYGYFDSTLLMGGE